MNSRGGSAAALQCLDCRQQMILQTIFIQASQLSVRSFQFSNLSQLILFPLEWYFSLWLLKVKKTKREQLKNRGNVERSRYTEWNGFRCATSNRCININLIFHPTDFRSSKHTGQHNRERKWEKKSEKIKEENSVKKKINKLVKWAEIRVTIGFEFIHSYRNCSTHLKFFN